ncbi:MAG: orotate phosphoribosyltransferase [Tissierellia bacterium]|nr:orotate phosphoribosyltransferase [Tissierellia bacterium]
MERYKREFIDFMLENKALKFGDFTLKSGRKSPFFMNAGSYNDGKQVMELSEFYAKAIKENFGLDFDVLFGPAYKGIPLAVATAMSIYRLYGKKVKYSSNRKEIKDHGDKGIFLGDDLSRPEKVVIIEDVTTSGKSIEETYPIISRNPQVDLVGLIVSLNRCEHASKPTMTALDEISEKYGFKTASIVTMQEVIAYLKEDDRGILSDDIYKKIQAYYDQYGVKN